MAFDLKADINSAEPALVVHYKDGVRVMEEVEAEGEIKIWMRPLTGADDREISNNLIVVNKRGGSSVMAGTTDRIKVCRSVTKIEGLEMDGRPIEVLSAKIYDLLPKWLLDPMKEKVAELNAEFDDDDLSE